MTVVTVGLCWGLAQSDCCNCGAMLGPGTERLLYNCGAMYAGSWPRVTVVTVGLCMLGPGPEQLLYNCWAMHAGSWPRLTVVTVGLCWGLAQSDCCNCGAMLGPGPE